MICSVCLSVTARVIVKGNPTLRHTLYVVGTFKSKGKKLLIRDVRTLNATYLPIDEPKQPTE